MIYGADMSRVWSELTRRENELKWGGNSPGFGSHYDSMGRLAGAPSFDVRWAREQLGRVERVRQALEESGPQAQRMITQQLAGIDLSTIWSILISACKDIALIYGGSVVAGSFIGGVSGAFAGGVGAIPGAAAGGAAGGYVGGWVLGLLGLASLVDGVTGAIPDAMRYYERGFSEAWGPTRHDHQHPGICSGECNVSSAAFDLANGHVIMVSAILGVLAAYLTRGRSDKAALLTEIGRSSRLGPKVARWVEQNEDRLRKLPALQSQRSGSAGSRVSPGGQPPPPKRGREPKRDREPEPQKPAGMPQKKVPCFKPNDLPHSKVPEFDRQLAGQEAGINNMTVKEYLDGRAAFDNKTSTRDPNLARRERTKFENSLINNLIEKYQVEGLDPEIAEEKAKKAAADKMKTLAALHNPDMVAGGKDVIADFGDENVNKRIGAQWNKGDRLMELDSAAKAVPEALRDTKMNAKLERCK